MKLQKRLLVAAAIVAAATVVGAQSDPTIGTWKLNLAKSKYSAGEPPKSSTVVIEPAGQGIKLTATTVIADGSTRRITYTASYDGKDAVVTGTPDYNGMSLKKVGGAVEGSRKKDGKTMTVKASGTTASGQRIESTQVYDKQ